MVVRPEATHCRVGEYVARAKVCWWPMLTPQAAIAFKRFTGRKVVQGKLHRMGNHIFEVGESDLAECVYNHSRQF